MKKFSFFSVLLFCISCQKSGKVPNEQELLQQELKQINWNQVDEYPTIEDCEKISDKEQQKQCFFEFLSVTIQEKLNTTTLPNASLDTINVKVIVNTNATLSFEPQDSTDLEVYTSNKLDSILASKLVDFPKIKPATKHGIPVKTQFVLPVVLRK